MQTDSENQSEPPTTPANESTPEFIAEAQCQSCADCTPKPHKSRFDWGPDNDDLLVPSQPALAVYVNPWGQIVIRQEGEIFEDDSYVIIGSAHVPALIEKLQELNFTHRSPQPVASPDCGRHNREGGHNA
jgi:hypothetical protein